MSTWWGDSKTMEEIEFSRWLFVGRPRQVKNELPDRLNWLCYFAGSSKSHCENSISCIFLESPHQVDMKNVVKCYKHFFGYFNALKTHGEAKQPFLWQERANTYQVWYVLHVRHTTGCPPITLFPQMWFPLMQFFITLGVNWYIYSHGFNYNNATT